MWQYTYLAINFFTIIICFIFSFHPKIKFYRHFKAFLLASIVTAIFFIAWDVWFTSNGVWWFNDKYLIGLRLFGLPIEELLFFICIPFSCVFTYFCLDKFFRLDWKPSVEKVFVIISIISCLILALIFKVPDSSFIVAVTILFSIDSII